MKTFICIYPVCAIKRYVINQTIFFTYEWFWFGIPESYLIKRFVHVTDAIIQSCLYLLGCIDISSVLVSWYHLSEAALDSATPRLKTLSHFIMLKSNGKVDTSTFFAGEWNSMFHFLNTHADWSH